MLRIDVVAMPLAITRVASIMAQRQFDVVTMDVAAPVDGLRRITVEVDTADEIRLDRLVKFLNRSPDVVKVVHLSDERSHTRREVFGTVTFPEGRLAELETVPRSGTATGGEGQNPRPSGIATIMLTLAGLSLGKDLPLLRRTGWKIVPVGLVAITASFLLSVVIAEFTLGAWG
ncbi:hypothetical protein ACWCOW_38990 [Streptomyces sp. NPDC001939]